MDYFFWFRRITLILILAFSDQLAFADHPNQGSLTLDQLLKEAEDQNLEIKEAEARKEAAILESKSKFAPLMPKFVLQGGPLVAQFESEKSSGFSLYGKAEWNLYRGGKDSDEIEKSKIISRLEERRLQFVKSNIRQEVSRVYYQLLFLLESSDLKKKAIEMNQEQMKLGQLKRNSGFTSSADVIEFELREATLMSDLKMLMQEVSEKSRELSLLLGRKDSSSLIGVRGHLVREGANVLSPDAFLAKLHDSNFEIFESLAATQIKQIDEKLAKANFLPSIDFEASYGKIASEERVFDRYDNYSLGLKISIPLFAGFETFYKAKSAQSEVVAKETSAAIKSSSLFAETENLFSKIETLNERLNLEEKTLSKSEEYYRITLAEYRRGVKNSPDMVGASERLLDARIRNLEYRKDYYLTKLKLNGLITLFNQL